MFKTADEFYRERDRRTTEFTGTIEYHSNRVAVVLHPAIAETYRGQLMFLLSLNLVSRYARCILAVCPDVPAYSCLAEHNVGLPDEALSVMRGSDPFGSFLVEERLEPGRWDYILQVGSGQISGVTPSLTVDALGWRVVATRGYCSQHWATEDAANPVGPGVAAALGVAESMKAALGLPQESWIEQLHLSCWDYKTGPALSDVSPGRPLPDSISIGRVWLVGAGMVGSALAYFLRRSRVEGDLDIIDHDEVAVHNLNRSPLFQMCHVGTNKASLLADYLKESELRPRAHPVLFKDFLDKNPRASNKVDLILPEANQYKVRAQIQHVVPPLMLHTTTSRNGGVVLGRHIPLVDECLSCRFPQDADQPEMLCGTVRHQERDLKESADVALPYQATLAAALLVGQIFQANMDGYPFTTNYALLDALGPVHRILTASRLKLGGCPYCAPQGTEVHQVINGPSRYAHLWAR